ncbi:MAG: hypothetical protein RIC55_21465 [Pirellulaceae bacterium]
MDENVASARKEERLKNEEKRSRCQEILQMADEYEADVETLATLGTEDRIFTIDIQEILAEAHHKKYLILGLLMDVEKEDGSYKLVVSQLPGNIDLHLKCSPEIAQRGMAIPRESFSEHAFVVSVESMRRPDVEVSVREDGVSWDTTASIVILEGVCHDLRPCEEELFISIEDVLGQKSR